MPRPGDAPLHGIKPEEGARPALTPHCHHPRRPEPERLVAEPMPGKRRRLGQTVPPAVQEPEPDQGVPEAKHRPGYRDEEAGEEHDIDGRPAMRADDGSHPGFQPEIRSPIEP